VKIRIDPDLCSGHGRCYSVAPDVYRADDDGYSVPRGEDIEVPSGLEASATLGIDSCPEAAISVVLAGPLGEAVSRAR
jgi:ferredoxin